MDMMARRRAMMQSAAESSGGVDFARAHVYEIMTGDEETATLTVPLDLDSTPVFAMLIIDDELPTAPDGKIFALSVCGSRKVTNAAGVASSANLDLSAMRAVWKGSTMDHYNSSGTMAVSTTAWSFTITRAVSGYDFVFPPRKKFKLLVCEPNWDVPL